MRLASFTCAGRAGFGPVEGEYVLDVASDGVPSLRAMLALGDVTTSLRSLVVTRRCALSEVVLLPPITEPDKIICVGLNYTEHAKEAGQAVPNHPSLFVRFPGSQVGHRTAIICPRASASFDFESELAVVIGRRGRHIPTGDALNHVAGFSCFGDHSLRDWQKHAPQITPGKNFHHSGSFGPWLTTTDSVSDVGALELIGRLNGIEMQRDSVAGMIFSIPELIHYISTFSELLPGDVIATGTPAGVGFSRKPPVFMKPGDVFEIEIPGVGILTNPVVAEMPS